jgi:transcriptional regulator with XRE-family HTH domain
LRKTIAKYSLVIYYSFLGGDLMAKKDVESTLGGRLKVARVRAGLSQTELARMLGMNSVSLSNVECGRRGLSMKQLVRVAKILEVPVAYLLGVDEKEEEGMSTPEGDLARMVQLVADEHPDLIVHLRGVIENWDRLSSKDKKFLADSLALALGTLSDKMEELQ